MLEQFPSYTGHEYRDVYFAFSKKDNKFFVVGKDKNGEFSKLNEVRDSKRIPKTVLDIDDDDKNRLQGDAVTDVIEFKNMNKKISISIEIDRYGEIKATELVPKKLPDGRMVDVQRDIKTQTQMPTEQEIEDIVKEEENDTLEEVIDDTNKLNGRLTKEEMENVKKIIEQTQDIYEDESFDKFDKVVREKVMKEFDEDRTDAIVEVIENEVKDNSRFPDGPERRH